MLQMTNVSSNPKNFKQPSTPFCGSTMLISKKCGSTKFWITHLCFHKMCGKLFENFVDPQSWKPKNCGSTKVHIKILWIHKTAKDWEITALMHLDWKKRPCGSPRNFFLGFRIWPQIFVDWLDFREPARLQKNPPLLRFSFFCRHKKCIDLKKIMSFFLNRLHSETCFNSTGIDQ